MKKLITIATLSLFCLAAFAQQPRHLLQKAWAAIDPATLDFAKACPYPAYSDRAAWEKLSAPFRSNVILRGEKYLNFNWELQRASAYLKYEKTGDRKLALPEEHNREALIALTLAELCEGKGRFLMQLADGLWFLSQQYSWAHFEHTK